MQEKRYRIISAGNPLKGHAPGEVLQKVSAIFGTTPEKTRQLLAGRPVLVKGGMDEMKARKLYEALRKAGLSCKAEQEMIPSTKRQGPKADAQDTPATIPPTAGAPPNVRAAIEARSIDPPMRQVAIEHTVIQCNEITSATQGLNFHKPGLMDVPLTDIVMMSVFQVPTGAASQMKLMIFLRQSKRPLTINAQNIKYWTFEGLTTQSVNLSLKQFIAHAYAQNHELILDLPTVGFLDNDLPRMLSFDESMLASALGKQIESEGLFISAPATSTEDEDTGPEMTEMLKALKAATTVEFNPERHARPRIWLATTMLSASMGFTLWVLFRQMMMLQAYEMYFSAARHPILNHLLMWSSALGAVVIIALAAHVLILIRRRSKRAPGMLNTYAVLFVLYSGMRFTALATIAYALRKGHIMGALSLFELPLMLKSRYLVLDALLISPLLISLPLAYLLMRIFSYNYAVRSEFIK